MADKGKPKSRAQGWVFTHNNYNDEIVARYKELMCSYIAFGKEVGEKKTPHLQGYVFFSSLKSFEQVRKLFDGAHIEMAKAKDFADQYNYVSKGTDFFEKGTRPLTQLEKGEKSKDLWVEARKAALERRYDDIPADIYIRNFSSIKRIKYDAISENPSKLDGDGPFGLWIWGPGGTGKTWFVEQNFKPLYRKSADRWWDDYSGEPYVLLDEFEYRDLSVVGKSSIKRWTDRYPFRAEVKGAYLTIRPKLFIITSNFDLDDIIHDEADVNAIKRRFKVVKFDSLVIDRVI